MSMEKTPQAELSAEQKEKMEKFEAELQENIESIAGLTEAEFIEQNLEVFGDKETAKKIYQEMEFPLRGFDTWDENLSEPMIEALKQQIGPDAQITDSVKDEEGNTIEVLQAKKQNMQVVKITDPQGNTEWLLKPFEAKA